MLYTVIFKEWASRNELQTVCANAARAFFQTYDISDIYRKSL